MTPPDNTSIYERYRSSETVAYEILTDLGMDMDENYMLHLGNVVRWIFRANVQMGAIVTYESKPWTGYVQNCSVTKPCDFVKLQDVLVGMCHQRPLYAARSKFVCDRAYMGFRHDCQMTVSESHAALDFSSNADGEPVWMQYLAYRHDENGFPLVDNNFYDAIVAYCRFCFARQRNDNRENEFLAKWQNFARHAKSIETNMAINHYFIDQVLSKFSDPDYVKSSPYARSIQNQNTIFAHRGVLGAQLRTTPIIYTNI